MPFSDSWKSQFLKRIAFMKKLLSHGRKMLLVLVCGVVLCNHGAQADHQSSKEVRINTDARATFQACNIDDCLPFINFRETLYLTYFQKQQIKHRRGYLRTVRGRLMNAGVGALRHGGSVVDITPEQRGKILAMYGSYFASREELPVQNSVQKREVDICPRAQSWDDLVLKLTNNDELIEVVQFNDEHRQWVLEETCSQSTCSFVPQCTCGTWNRYVRALVVNFDETVIAERFIKVYCCVAQKLSTT